MPNLPYKILHRIRGRIRIRLNRVKNDRVFEDHLYAYLKHMPGVRAVTITAACSSVTILFEENRFSPDKMLSELSEHAVLFADIPLGKDRRKRLRKNAIYKLAHSMEAPPAVQLSLGVLALASAVFSVPTLLTRSILCLAAIPILGRGVRTVYEEGRPAVDFTDCASVVLLTLESAYVPAAVMASLIGFGEYIRDFAAKKSEGMIDELLSLTRSSAWLIKQDTRIRVPIERIEEGDAVVVYTGEQVPVQGRISHGNATVIKANAAFDELPIELGPGDEVPAESIVLEGKLYIKCTAARKQHVMDRIMERERRRLLYRTAYQRNALKTAYSIVTPLMVFAAGAFLLSRNLNMALTIVCFDFVTGIRIALPTSVLAFMYKAGKEGVLIKTGAALEMLSKVDVIVFARTGVITAGESEVNEVIALADVPADDVLAAAAAVEHRYHHPAARAIYRYAKRKNISIPGRSNSDLIAGLGVFANVDGKKVIVGSRRMMRENGISVEQSKEVDKYIKARGDSVAYVAFDDRLVGMIAYHDSVRPEAANALARLRQQGIRETIMTSGDAGEPVERIANEIGVERVFTQLSPEEKADLIRDYQLKGLKVAVIGDDVSDALAMAQADLGIAMNDSTDVCRYRADIIITDNDLAHLPIAVDLSRTAMQYLRQNMLVVSVPNWAGLLLSITNRIGPIRGTVLNNGSVIIAALNGLLPAMVESPIIELQALNPETETIA